MKLFKQSNIIKITTIIITAVLCFNFMPSGVYAYSRKQNIENNSFQKNVKYNTKKNNSRYVKFYVQDGYYYNPYIFEIGWNINKKAEEKYIDKVNITLNNNSAIKIYFDNNTKEYSKEKKVINAIKELLNSLGDTYPSMKKVLITRITHVKKSDVLAYAKKYYKNKDNIAFSALFPYLNKKEQEKYLDKIYKSGNIALFAKAIKYAGKDLILMYTDKALKDDEPGFISIMLNYTEEKDLKRYFKQYTRKSYESGNISLFSILIWYMPETEVRKWMYQAEKDNKTNFVLACNYISSD